MEIKLCHEVEAKRFESDAVKGVAGRVLIGKADGAPNFCMRMFEIAPGGFTPRHAHPWEHEMFYHSGRGEVFGGGKWNPVQPGSVVLVEPNEEHQIRNTGDAPLVLVCLVPSGVPEL